MRQSQLNLCFSFFFLSIFFVALGFTWLGLFFLKGVAGEGMICFSAYVLAIFSAFCEYGRMNEGQLRQYVAMPEPSEIFLAWQK